MGLIACRARLLLEAKRNGVKFSSTLTLGRQLINMTASELAHLRKIYSISKTPDSDSLKYRSYADQFFSHYLGSKKLNVMDYSDYQGADIIHDLNYPIKHDLEEAFDVVVDGGTLEHIFNFPTAVSNCMRMLKKGGSLFIFSNANNHCGHGFYQFSPELFFRIFQMDNGFETKAIILVKHPFPGAELSRRQKCFRVKDPALIGRRSVIVTKSPVGMMVHAIKIARRPLFERYPQQSDYVSRWSSTRMNDIQDIQKGNSETIRNSRLRSVQKDIWKRLPFRLKLSVAGLHQLWKFSLSRDKAFFTRWP